jgi:hypothetical protein
MNRKEKHVVYLALSISRVVFLFGDYFLSNNNLNISISNVDKKTDIDKQTDVLMQDEYNNISTSDLTSTTTPLPNI